MMAYIQLYLFICM